MRIGFACIPLGLGRPMTRTCRLKFATSQRLDELIGLNLAALNEALDYAAGLGLRMFRVSSDTIPFGSHPVNRLRWWRTHARRLAAIGAKAARLDVRLSMHPGQYTVLSSPSRRVAEAAARDLEYHARLLDAMGCPESSKIILHLGGAYGDRAASLSRFADGARRLPAHVRRRLALENDDRVWTIQEALEAALPLGLPVVFDDFHHRLLPGVPPLTAREALRRAARTWKAPDGAPKMHFSSQQPGGRRGAHAELIDEGELEDLLDAGEGIDFDLMIEAKGKERAALLAKEVVSRRQARRAQVLPSGARAVTPPPGGTGQSSGTTGPNDPLRARSRPLATARKR